MARISNQTLRPSWQDALRRSMRIIGGGGRQRRLSSVARTLPSRSIYLPGPKSHHLELSSFNKLGALRREDFPRRLAGARRRQQLLHVSVARALERPVKPAFLHTVAWQASRHRHRNRHGRRVATRAVRLARPQTPVRLPCCCTAPTRTSRGLMTCVTPTTGRPCA